MSTSRSISSRLGRSPGKLARAETPIVAPFDCTSERRKVHFRSLLQGTFFRHLCFFESRRGSLIWQECNRKSVNFSSFCLTNAKADFFVSANCDTLLAARQDRVLAPFGASERDIDMLKLFSLVSLRIFIVDSGRAVEFLEVDRFFRSRPTLGDCGSRMKVECNVFLFPDAADRGRDLDRIEVE